MLHNTTPKYTTSYVATAANVHRATLARWEREGLIPPPLRTNTGQAIYTDAQVAQVRDLAAARKAAWRPTRQKSAT